MTHNSEDRKQLEEQSHGHTYHAPKLTIYGAMRDLTAAGTNTRARETDFQNPSGQGVPRP